MGIKITDHAYGLWVDSTQKLPFSDMPLAARKDITIHYLTNKLFQTLTENKWYTGIANFFSKIIKAHLLKHVRTALSAYKFDLITSSKKLTAEHLWLFEAKELPYTDTLREIFAKNLLHKKIKSIEAKSNRWEMKVEKYQGNPRYLFANTSLSLLGDRFPKLKKWIGIAKPLKAATISRTANKLFENDSQAFQQGVFNVVAKKDFSLNRSLQSLVTEAVFEISKEKVKSAWRTAMNSCWSYYNGAKKRLLNP